MLNRIRGTLNLADLAARAATLGERLAQAGLAAPHHDAAATARLDRWTRVVSGSDPAALERRLSWDGLSLAQALGAVSGTQLAPSHEHLPAWATTAGEIADAAAAIADHGWPDDSLPPTNAVEPLPYEALLLPAVLVARRRLTSFLAPFASQAQRDLERALLERLCRIAARAIHAEFVETLPFGRRLRRSTANGAAGDGSHEHHDAFVNTILDAGLVPLFERYPVLARLVATAVDQHVTTSAELARRVHADLVECGPVVSIQAHLSDFHNGGRSVAALTFTNGARMVYKPKSLALDVAFGAILHWCNALGATPPLEAPAVLDHGDYGYVAFVSHASCDDDSAVARFYERAGMLLGIVYALGGTDCHRGNIVAAGEHLFLVDLETLLHHEARAMSPENHMTDAMQSVIWRFRDSVLRTGFIPRWDYDSDGGAFDVSGLGGADGGLTEMQDLLWRNVGTDDIALVMGTVAAPLDESTPTLRGNPLSAGDHIGELTAGFERMYRLLVAHRAELLAPAGPMAALYGCTVRFIFRPTIVYALLRDRALAPDVLHDGTDRTIELEALCRGFLTSAERPLAWPILRAEVEAMERLDVPLFATTTDSDALQLDHGIALPSYFESPSHGRVVAQIARMGDDDLARQLEILRLAFDARAAREEAPPPTRIVVAPVHDGLLPTRDALIAAAVTIAEEIVSRAVRGNDDSAAWVDIGYAPLADRFQLQPMGLGLYDGADGIALFLAALERVTGNRRFHSLTLGALQQSRRVISSVASRAQRLGIGGVTGLGSIIYVLVRVAELIDEPSLLDDAARAAALLDAALIANDQQLDVMSGSAGALLALLALHAASGDAAALAGAHACGLRLLEARVSVHGLPAAWPTLGGRQLAGFSHGASGIAHALLRLHAATGERAFLEAATDGIAFERQLYSPSDNGWPDLRADGAPRFATSWCNGASGIALARASAAALLGGTGVEDDAELAVRAIEAAGWEGVNHLCCGSAGRIEALLVASERLIRPEWGVRAAEGGAALLAQASSANGYQLFANVSRDAYSPGFFRGTAGIGYQLLRLARPALLPSVLLLE